MGLLNIGAGIAAAGGALSDFGKSAAIEEQKAGLEREKITLAAQLADTNAARQSEREEAVKIRTEGRLPELTGATEKAKLKASVEMAPEMLKAKINEVTAVHQAQLDFDTNPDNVQKKAVAEAAKSRYLLTSAADLSRELMERPDYLKNLEAIALAEHPEKRAQIAASLASAAKSNFELQQGKLLAAAKKELVDAGTNPEAVKIARAKVSALEWSVASDRSQQAADSTVIKTMEAYLGTLQTKMSVAFDPAEKARLQREIDTTSATFRAYVNQYSKDRGIEIPPAPGKTGYDTAAGEVWKDGIKIGSAKSAAEADKMIHSPAVKTNTVAPPGILSNPRAPYYKPEMESRDPHLASLRLRAEAGDEGAWRDYLEKTR